MLTFTSANAHDLARKNLGDEAAEEIAGLDFLAFPDLEEQVRRDVEFLRGTRTVSEEVAISGWVYEVETGKVRRVE